MAPDAFSEQRRHGPPLALDPTHTAVIVVDMVNEFFEPGGKMVLAGGTALYAPVKALARLWPFLLFEKATADSVR